jgi:hypothetical protein
MIKEKMADGVNYSLKGFDQYEIMLGDELRGERATVNKSLLDVQKDLRIKASYIAAIENCDLEVFSNRGFIAGYVRSYARYLALDPDIIYERFCRESGFSSQNAELTLQGKKFSTVAKKDFGSGSDWRPGLIGQISSPNMNISGLVINSAPLMLVLIVLFGTGFGAISVLREVQKLEVVALEEIPEVFTELPSNSSEFYLSEYGIDIYTSQELELPVFEARDKAVSTLKPELLTALEDKSTPPSISYSVAQGGMNVDSRKQNLQSARYSIPMLSEPILRTVPKVPEVRLLAMTPAWVRIKNANGDVIFEKILKQHETYLIKKSLFKGQLRAGNAQNVYVLIDKQALGPLSNVKSVVKNVSLDPESLKNSLVFSSSVTESFKFKTNGKVIVNTAEVVD